MKTRYGFLLVSLLITVQLYAAPIASILKVKNNVSIKKEADFEFQANITAGTAIDIFDKLNTGAESYAAVIFLDDKSMVKIRENSEIEISESGNIREITIDKGQVLFDVNPQKIKDFVVKTPVSVASVKGTSFWVITDGKSEQFITKEGVVNVFNPETMESMDVPAGQMCMISADGLMNMRPFTAADLPDESIFEDEAVTPEPEEVEEEEEAVEETVEEEVIEEEIIEEPESIPEEDNTDTETVSSAPITVPAAEEMPVEDVIAEEEKKPAKKKSGNENFGMGMGVGAVTLDGVLYNQIAARPTFKIGKIGVGLDIVLYIDNEGNIRKDDWDNFASYVDKIFFLSWGNKGDPIYAKVGGLDNITIGNGILVNGYTNMLEYPDVKRMGVDFSFSSKNIGVEAFMADWKEFGGESKTPGLVAARASYKGKIGLPFTAGLSFAGDVNPYNAFDKDRDGDKYSDLIDMFPDDSEAWEDNLDRDRDGLIDNNLGLSNNLLEDIVRANPNYTGIDTDVDPITIEKISEMMTSAPRIYSAAFDFTVPVLSNKILGINLYTEEAVLHYSGRDSSFNMIGMAPIGISSSILGGIVSLKLEYRIAQENFVYGFFDRNYDIARVYVEQENNSIVGKTKMDAVMNQNIPAVKGVYGAITGNLFNVVTLSGSYMDMRSGDDQIKSFNTMASLKKGLVPKLSGADAYYIRNNDENPFDFKNPSSNTIMGYRISMEISEGVNIIWNNMISYRDIDGDGIINPETEAVKVMLIETGFDF